MVLCQPGILNNSRHERAQQTGREMYRGTCARAITLSRFKKAH